MLRPREKELERNYAASMREVPDTRYARAPDGVYLAYRTIGRGPFDMVVPFDWMGNVDVLLDNEPTTIGMVEAMENDTAGDGFYATFDGPASAIRCALAVIDRVRELGLEVRAGVHTGECTMIDGKIGGLAVSIGAGVAATGAPPRCASRRPSRTSPPAPGSPSITWVTTS
jgi:class 3 adenylate cyclase